MPYLNLDLDFFSHPKTVRLVGLLGRDAEVLPIRLWCYCGRHHCVSGRLSGYSPQEVESAVGWWGKSGEMVAAMLKVGFIEQVADGYQVHDWSEHAGHLAAFKKRAKSAARKRWRSIATSNAKRDIKDAPNLPNLPNLPNQEKEKRSTRGANPAVRSVIETFSLECVAKRGYQPAIAGGKDGAVVKRFLGRHSEEQARELIAWFLGSPKCADLGASIATCFSAHTINLWQESQARAKSLTTKDYYAGVAPDGTF